MSNEIIDLIFKVVISIIFVIVTKYVIPLIKSKIDSTKYGDFLSLIEKCVEAANQIYTPEEWIIKKQYVLEITEAYAKEHGINITASELNALIEGFVIAVKG